MLLEWKARIGGRIPGQYLPRRGSHGNINPWHLANAFHSPPQKSNCIKSGWGAVINVNTCNSYNKPPASGEHSRQYTQLPSARQAINNIDGAEKVAMATTASVVIWVSTITTPAFSRPTWATKTSAAVMHPESSVLSWAIKRELIKFSFSIARTWHLLAKCPLSKDNVTKWPLTSGHIPTGDTAPPSWHLGDYILMWPDPWHSRWGWYDMVCGRCDGLAEHRHVRVTRTDK